MKATRIRVNRPGFARWDVQVRSTFRKWIEQRARTQGAARASFGPVEALDEVLRFAHDVLGVNDAPKQKQAKRGTPVARKVNEPGKKHKANGKAKG